MRNVQGDEVQAGRSLARLLNEETPVSVAFWNYEPDHDRWRLVLGVGAVDRFGMRRSLQIAQRLLANTKLTLDDVRVLGLKDSVAGAVETYLPSQQEGDYPEINDVTLGDYDVKTAIVIWTQRPLPKEELARREEAMNRRPKSHAKA